MKISPEQCRAARAWLDWSQEDLAEAANVSLSTVRDFEKGRRQPIANNMMMMKQAFEAQSLHFTYAFDGTPLGVEMTLEGPRI